MKLATRFVLLAAVCLCARPPALVADQPTSGTSPGGHVHYEVRPAGDTKEIWVYRDGDTTGASKLCETPGWGNLKLFFSPDERWIIVQDGGASLGVSLRLFHPVGEHSYAERDKEDIDDKAEAAALRSAGAGGGEEISDHRYTECLDWSDDSRYVLVRVHGTGSDERDRVVFSWVGVYDLETGKMGTDLSKLNESGVHRVPRGGAESERPAVGKR